MYDIMADFFNSFGLDRMPETFPELIPWLVMAFLAIGLVIYVFDLLFIVVKAIAGRGKGI